MHSGFKGSITEHVAPNNAFRRVLYTGEQLQLVAMTLQPLEDIGEESHEGHDQFIHITAGTGIAKIHETEYDIAAGDMVLIPSGALHNVTNTSADQPLVLYTLYGPPEHAEGTVHEQKPVGE